MCSIAPVVDMLQRQKMVTFHILVAALLALAVTVSGQGLFHLFLPTSYRAS